MNHGWQSESTDGLEGGWSCVFGGGYNGCSGRLLTSPTTAGCSCSVVELWLWCGVMSAV